MQPFAVFALFCTLSSGQPGSPKDFFITLERGDCLGTCPVYKVTIVRDGYVKYEGRAYVKVKGVREGIIPIPSIEKLTQTLQEEDFFQWEKSYGTCVDVPTVKISAAIREQHNDVSEGFLAPSNVLELAKQIDDLVKTKRWVGH